jgi:hypothetical protein
MSRYFIATKKVVGVDTGDIVDYYPDGSTEGRDIFITEGEPTGILCPSGNMIWRYPDRVGFNLERE